MRSQLSVLVFALLGAVGVEGHARWKCPAPRDENDANGKHIAFDNTGNKYGACGPFSGMYGMNGVRSLKPGPLTLTWEESIAHVGSPFRLAILDEHEKVKVVLADHIPHNDAAKSSFLERTYTPYHLTVEIPDVECEKCTLQLIYFMTDKTVKCGSLFCTYHADDSACSGHIDAAQPTCFGAPNDVPCKEKDSCFSNYHTCTDVSIAGTRAIEEFDLDLQPLDWPYKNLTMSVYGAEEAEWEGGWLKNVPARFTQVVDFLEC